MTTNDRDPLMDAKMPIPAIGSRICHETFGNGTVVSVRSVADSWDTVSVDFDRRGRRELLWFFACQRMTVLDEQGKETE